MNENEYLKVNDRYYVNPQLSVDESEQFLEKLKTAQAEGNARIAQETHNLGTDVPSSMGGLSGSGGVWQQRYQNPQVNSMVADLKATAQAQALNETMSNLLAQKQQQYKEAYRKAYKKSTNPTTKNPDTTKGEVEKKVIKPSDTVGSLSGYGGKYTVVSPDGRLHIVDMETGEEEIVNTNKLGK